MHLDNLITDLALIMIVAGVVTLICKKLKLSVLLGYIIAGFLISPNFLYLPTIIEVESINSWSNIGIVFLMFGLGLEFSFKKLADVGMNAIILTTTIMTGMIFIGIFVGKLLDWSAMDCIFLGGTISISSTMVILKSYEEFHLKKEKFATLVLGALLLEDIAGIFMMIILTSISVSKNTSGIAIFSNLGLMLLLLVIWVVLGIYIIPTFLNRVKGLMNNESLVIVSLAICLGMVAIGLYIGFSEALGAFLAGSILAGTLQGEKIEHLVEPIRNMFGAIFFVSVGMMVQPDMLVKYIGPILLIAIITIVFQMSFATLGILLAGRGLHTAVRGGFSMVQIGEFSFIIAALGVSLGVTSDFLYPIIVCVSVVTIITTPIFMKNSERTYLFLERKLPVKIRSFFRKYTSERKNGNGKDNDWKRYTKKYITRLLISAAALYTIYIAAMRFGMPIIDKYDEISVNILVAGITVVLMLLVVFIMSVERRSDLYKKLWFKSRTNRLPLITLYVLRMLVSVLFITLICRKFLGLPYWMLAIIAVILIAITARLGFKSSANNMIEARFISNLNEKTLHMWQKERGEEDDDTWLSSRLYVVEYSMGRVGDLMTVDDLCDSRFYDILVVKIIRDKEEIVMPKETEPLYDGDIIHAMSGKDQLDAYIYQLKKTDHINDPEEPMITLKDYIYGQVFHEVEPKNQVMCVNIRATKDGYFDDKTIRDCGFRQKYNGYIMCVERGHYPIVDPHPDTFMKAGDMLWTIGTQSMVDKLLRDGLIEG